MAGITITSQPAFWNDLNALSNCYYATDWGNKGEVSPGTTGVTLAQLCNTNISEGWTLLGKNIMPVPAAMRQDNGWKCNIRTELWFTPDGLQVPAPKSADGKIYIKVTIYDDGTQTTRRITNR